MQNIPISATRNGSQLTDSRLDFGPIRTIIAGILSGNRLLRATCYNPRT